MKNEVDVVLCVSWEELVKGLVTIYVCIALICSAKADTIKLQMQNSPDLTPKFRSLVVCTRS